MQLLLMVLLASPVQVLPNKVTGVRMCGQYLAFA
jgi:hypothetical protein